MSEMGRQSNKQNRQMEPRRTMAARSSQTTGFIDDRNAVALRFADRETSNRAIGIILAKAPDHTFLFPDPLTIIMNKEDQLLFAGLQCKPEEVAKPDEVSNEEMAELRFKNLFGGETKDH